MAHRSTRILAGLTGALMGVALTSTSVAALTTAEIAPSGSEGAVDTAVASGAASSEVWINYVAPRAEAASSPDREVGVAGRSGRSGGSSVADRSRAVDRKHMKGNPVTARQLAKVEAKAIKEGKSPKKIKSQYKSAKSTQQAKLLTILVEFNDQANDDFTGSMVPTAFQAEDCMPGSVQNGPLHNKIPNPATSSLKDNNSMWVKDFSSEHFNKMLYTDAGITERVRPDLTGPDGKPGIDISGFTMKKMYEEMSKGAYTVTGAATPWITVPHSEAWYGATVCHRNADGEWVYGAMQDMQGHPDNPAGPGQLPIDAVAALAKAQPNFPWADYDIEDQGDIDGDGNLFEPDGVIDHVVLVHAGEDKSGGGGAEGTYAIWAHSSAVPGGAPVPGTNLRLSNYIVQPEDSGVGVFAHEYGHDLGLPDLYDTSGNGDSDVDFWDLMSSGSHSGPIFQSMPTHMGIWDKWVLGWVDPLVLNPGDGSRAVQLGQTSRTPKGTEDGIKINLPNKTVTLAEPHSGASMWYSSSDQSWAKNTLTRDVAVPAGTTDAKFWAWNTGSIEEDWDFGFVEVSTDGGTTWSQQKLYDESGAEVTTADDYADPNGRLKDFGGENGPMKYGLTGTMDGWQHYYADLSAFAGRSVKVRFLYATDAAYEDTGWFLDDLSVTAGGATTWSDDAEANNGWTPTVGTFVNGSALGAGWVLDAGTYSKAQYYMVEWRNFDGFDEGLKYAYDTTYSTDGAWKVEKIAYNAPGALVWYRDTSYGNVNHIVDNRTSLPSEGAKGGLLIVDSHYDPLRRTGANAELDPSTLKNLPSRPQSSNASFNLAGTYPFKECQSVAPPVEACNDFPVQAAVPTFTDNQGWYPGMEVRGSRIFYRDVDASTVVPSRGNAPYSTRVVNPDGSPLTDAYGTDIGLASPLGSGNPSDDGVGYGTQIQVFKTAKGNVSAQIRVTPPKK